MGRVFLIQFDQTPQNRFYLCRTCRAHIALSRGTNYQFADNDLNGGVIFLNAVNLHTPDQNRRVGDRVVADVYCVQCFNLLGVKFIEVSNEDVEVREGDFLLRLPKLLEWNGAQIVDAELV